MPTCPGCRERIPYRRLPVHSQYCPGIWTDGSPSTHQARVAERLHLTVRSREQRLEERIDELMSEVETVKELARNRQ